MVETQFLRAVGEYLQSINHPEMRKLVDEAAAELDARREKEKANG